MYIESHQSLLRNWKLGALARAIGVSKVTAIGHLHILWWWGLDNTPDGNLTGISEEDIAEGAMWEGDAHTFVSALIRAGFVDSEDGEEQCELSFHNWQKYGGKIIASRQTNAEKQARFRKKQRDGNVTEDSTNKSDTSNQHVTVTLPSRNQIDKIRVDKTRVDKRNLEVVHTSPNLEPSGNDTFAADAAMCVPISSVEEIQPITRTRTAPKPRQANAEQLAAFERWYQLYPVHKQRQDAERAWLKLNPDAALICRLEEDVGQRRQRDRQWQEGYIPHPATYLNGRRWEDDIDDKPRTSVNGKRGGHAETRHLAVGAPGGFGAGGYDSWADDDSA